MIIERLEAVPYTIPMKRPLHFASGQVDRIEHVLLRLTTRDGIVGIADIPPRPYTYGETQASVLSVLESVFAPVVVGEDARDRGRIHRRLARTVGNVTAKAGIDVAVWDIIGQALGQPVHRLLGGYTDSARVCHMIGFADGAEMLDEALSYREQYGVTTFKIKVGRRPASVDVEAVRIMRDGLGDDAELYLDANRGWSAVEAMQVLQVTADLGLTFFEEPCDAAEVMGRRRLTSHSPLPIVADESAPTLGDAAREVMTGGATALSIKTARSGFTEAQKILGMAEALGVEVIVGNQIDTQLGSTATVTFAAAFAHASHHAAELSNFLDMADDLIAEPLVIVDGRIAAPTVPGVGARIDHDKLARYRTDGGGRS